MTVEQTKSQDKSRPAQEEYDNAKAQLERFSRLAESVRAQIESERKEGPLDESSLKMAISEKTAQYNKYQEEANTYRDWINKLKQDISDWKQWYNFIADIDKSDQMERLDLEITWRAQEIKQLQEKIGALEAQKLDARVILMKNNQKLLALEKGLHKLPLKKDPRLVSVIARRDKATIKFDKAKKLINPKH